MEPVRTEPTDHATRTAARARAASSRTAVGEGARAARGEPDVQQACGGAVGTRAVEGGQRRAQERPTWPGRARGLLRPSSAAAQLLAPTAALALALALALTLTLTTLSLTLFSTCPNPNRNPNG